MDFLAQWRGKRVLLTGGTGFIGRHAAALGVNAGAEVHTLTHREQGVFLPGITSHVVDLKKRHEVMQAVVSIAPDGIIHLAAGGVTSGQNAVFDLLQINTMGLQALLEAAAQLNAPPPVVIAGSWFEYAPQNRPLREDDPTWAWSPYTASKIAAQAVAAYYAQQMPVTVLRIFSVYGPGEPLPRLAPSIIDAAIRRQPIELTGCEQVRDYVYVVDVARAFWAALSQREKDHRVRILNVGAGQPLILRVFVEKLAALLDARGLTCDLRFGVKQYRDHEAMYTVADISNISQCLKWKALTTLDDGLERAIIEQLGEQ